MSHTIYLGQATNHGHQTAAHPMSQGKSFLSERRVDTRPDPLSVWQHSLALLCELVV
jgi:hypothetical protein